MSRTPLPWGIHRVTHMIGDATAGLPDGRVVRAVPEPYHTYGIERLRAAWWVLTGRAHAVIWPDDGELENAIGGDAHVRLLHAAQEMLNQDG